MAMNTSEKLIIGMPAGSLADPNRGGSLNNLLKAAGFPKLADKLAAWMGPAVERSR